MYNWYSFEPNDTVFFRGAEPMEKGEDHNANFNFPPPVHTMAGAIRTYFYNIDKKNNEDKFSDIVRIGEEYGGFKLVGPFFKIDEKIYLPAPYSWFVEKSCATSENGKYNIIKGFSIQSDLIKTSSDDLYWAKGESELESIGGKWINYNDLINGSDKAEVKDVKDFYVSELRTGIALNKDHTARESHIYSFNHCRLKKGVSFIFGIDIDDLGNGGILTLGAEQRFGKFKKEDLEINLNTNGELFMSLSLMPASAKVNDSVISTGKIQYLGGWDLHKRFHKPMKGYFPAGTVFNSNFDNCISIN
ncbi:CRISPR-associated protein, Cmr3 [Flexistipes sinusarabici DSM 4947]|uniref:CRISPR-associated protein, Cmr3 n=1 Tax=Flexistipes sinusarabici (strain ATCC 49648 / DSM 4947 / MAS 10) TaxID=717231 RepID=F8E947_FLESM|nr:type III-B CRISPR module-associated Cmr3 family protein [Flexistipes sinusarabici]AEI15249.1 CRISPR-associated protein, Cmr3 [Flexistipes sinusarabici DSM 4947]